MANSTPQVEIIAPVELSVKPPASFTPDQLPQGRVKFLVSGNTGESLLVNVSDDGRHAYSVIVHPPGDSSTELSEPLQGDTCAGNFLYALPSTGTYQVLFDPAGQKHHVDLTLLAGDDAVLNPGITLEKISIDFGSFARKSELSVVPYSEIDGCGWDMPSNVVVENDQFEFRVMRVAGYKELFKAGPEMTLLEAALRPGGKVPAEEKLPYAYKEKWGAYITSARPQLLEGEGWRGLRWIRGSGGDEDYPSHGLGYMFEGISNDGRYFILVRAAIAHPDQKRFLPTRHINGTPPNTWEWSEPKEETEKRLFLEKSLAAADPASFRPNLDQLDAVIRSLKLKP